MRDLHALPMIVCGRREAHEHDVFSQDKKRPSREWAVQAGPSIAGESCGAKEARILHAGQYTRVRVDREGNERGRERAHERTRETRDACVALCRATLPLSHAQVPPSRLFTGAARALSLKKFRHV
jgi:hypothetical protein